MTSRPINGAVVLVLMLHPGGREAVRQFASFFTMDLALMHLALTSLFFLWMRRPRPGPGIHAAVLEPDQTQLVVAGRVPSQAEILEAAGRAATRASRSVCLDLQRGLSTLATIASTAFFLGCFGTCLGIVVSFRGVDGEKSTILAALVLSISESLMPTVLGLFVAITAWCFHQYCRAQTHTFEVEMRKSTLELMNYLGLAKGCVRR